MATFVLVHGAWQGGWCWTRVASRLRRSGHDVFTPTLTGLGERAHLLGPGTDLDTHIRDVLGVIECEELKDFVLCGHSYGGMVITGVADRVPDQMRSLVYLDALVPTDGLTVLDLLPTKSAAGLKKSARPSATGFRVPPALAEAFAVKAENRDWVDRRCVDHPLKAFEQPIRLEDKWKQAGRTVYVHATGWHPGIGKTSVETARKKGWRMLSLDCGHDVMIDRPEDLTRILIESK